MFFTKIILNIFGIAVAETDRYRPVQYLSRDYASSVVHIFEQVCSGFKWITAHYPQLLFRISLEVEGKPDIVVC